MKNIGKQHYFKIGPLALEMFIFSIFRSGVHFIQCSGTTCALLKESTRPNSALDPHYENTDCKI